MSSDGSRVAVAGYPFGKPARVYEYKDTDWSTIGSNIYLTTDAVSLECVSLNSDGSYVAIGNPQDSDDGHLKGAVTVYTYE